MNKTTPAPDAPTDGPPADRYRFIGFEVFPRHMPRFWKSDAEARQYVDSVSAGTGMSLLSRDFSLLQQEAMGRIDRIVLIITAVLMVATVAMPWVAYTTTSKTGFSLWWMGALGTLLGGLGTAFGGGLWVGLSALLALALMVGTPLLGLWLLYALLGKAPSPDAYLSRLRRPLAYGHYLWGAGAVVVVLALAGGHIPGFQNWGLIDPGEKYGIGTLVTVTSFGPWIAMGLGLVAGVKSGDL